MALTNVESLKQMVRAKAEQKGLGFLWSLIDYIVSHESGWNPSVQSSAIDPSTGLRENSWGLFQCLIDSSRGPGLGAGCTPEELQNPEINAEIALEHIRRGLAAGVPLQVAVDDWSVTHGIDVNQLLQGGASMADTTSGLTMPEDVRQKAERDWDGYVSQIMNNPSVFAPDAGLAPGQTVSRPDAEELLLAKDKVPSKEAWLEWRAGNYGWMPQFQAAEPMGEYQAGTLGLQTQQFEFDKALEEMAYKIEKEKWPIDKAAAEFANRISAATVGGTLAQTAEQIRTSQLARRAPPPNAPGGYQPYSEATAGEFGLKPYGVQPEIFADPWAEMQKGMGAAGPTQLPEMQWPTFPTTGGSSPIVQAYNNVTGGGAAAPPAAGMGPTPDILARGLQPPGGSARLAPMTQQRTAAVPGAPPNPAEGQRWTNPYSGEELIWRGGQWIPSSSMGLPPLMTSGGMRASYEAGR